MWSWPRLSVVQYKCCRQHVGILWALVRTVVVAQTERANNNMTSGFAGEAKASYTMLDSALTNVAPSFEQPDGTPCRTEPKQAHQSPGHTL